MHHTRVLQLSIFLNIIAITLVLVSLYHSGINMDLITAAVVVNLVVAVYLGITLYRARAGCRSLSYETAVVVVTILINAVFLDYAINGFPTYFGKMQKDTLQVIAVAGALVCSVLYIFTSCRSKPKKTMPVAHKPKIVRQPNHKSTRKSVIFVEQQQPTPSRRKSSVFEQILPQKVEEWQRQPMAAVSVRRSVAPSSTKTSVQSDISLQCDEYAEFLHNDGIFCRACVNRKLNPDHSPNN